MDKSQFICPASFRDKTGLHIILSILCGFMYYLYLLKGSFRFNILSTIHVVVDHILLWQRR